MKSQRSRANGYWRAARADRGFSTGLRLAACRQPAIPDNLLRNRAIRNTGRIAPRREHQMKAAIRSRALAQIFQVAGFGVALLASPASAQKQGGSITVGLELDIPGFDPLKVGVFDTAALTAAAALFDSLTYLDDKGAAATETRAVLVVLRTTSRPGPSSCVPASSSTTARRSMRKRSKRISTGRRIPPTSAAAPSISCDDQQRAGARRTDAGL